MMIIRLIALVFMLIVGVFALRRLADGFGEMGKKVSNIEVFRYAVVLDEPGLPPSPILPEMAMSVVAAAAPGGLARNVTPPVEAPMSAKAAADCLAGATPEVACLRALAKHDRAAANASAKGLTERDGELGVLARSLLAYADVAALHGDLASSGCTPATPSGDVLTLLDLLETSPCSHAFDPETGQVPNRHDALLATLAGLGSRDLAGPPAAVFHEAAPPHDGAPYALRAWAGGRRYTAQAQNLDDWYDVDAVIGLLNEVALRLGKAQRWLLVRADGNDAHVISADGPWLKGVVTRGLLPVVSGSERIADAIGREQVIIEGLGAKAAAPDAGTEK